MSAKNTPVITTDRLILRGKFPKDARAMLRYYTDPNVRKWLGGFPPNNTLDIKRMVGRDKSTSSFVIIEKQSDRIIGEIDLYNIVQRRIASIGYILLSDFWGKGYMTEAAKTVLEYGFEKMYLERIRACIMQGNVRSRALVERLSFELECEMQEADFGGRVEDVCFYSLHKKDFQRQG